MEELRNLIQYYQAVTGEDPKLLGVALSARKNLCIHPEVSKERIGKVVDGKCLNLTASFVRAKRVNDPDVPCCNFFEVSSVYRALLQKNTPTPKALLSGPC